MWIGWNGLGQLFVLGSHLVTLNFLGIIFHSLLASAEVNNAATVRQPEGLIMQSSITLMFPLITNIIFTGLLNKKIRPKRSLLNAQIPCYFLGKTDMSTMGCMIQSLTMCWLLFWLNECNQSSFQSTFSPGTQCYYLTFTGPLLSSTRNYEVNVIFLPTSQVASQNMWYILLMMKSDSACTRKEILPWRSCGENDGLKLFSEVIWEAGPDSLLSTLLCMP